MPNAVSATRPARFRERTQPALPTVHTGPNSSACPYTAPNIGRINRHAQQHWS